MQNKSSSPPFIEHNPGLPFAKLHCLLIGEDHFIIECAKVLITRKYLTVGIITTHEQVRKWAESNRISCFQSIENAEITLVKIDYLFSIVNSKIIPSKLLDRVKILAINYHHSPLPRYAGVNAPSWAIINNEKSHGVTWHVMNDAIDRGDILKQVLFPIEEHETALSLNLKCYQYALALFEELATELLSPPLQQTPQEHSQRTYYGLNHKPNGNGWVDWKKAGEEIEQYFRAFYLGAQDNKLSLLKFKLDDDIFIINELKISNNISIYAPGTVSEINPFYWRIATTSNDLIVSQILTLDGQDCLLEQLAEKYEVKKLSRLQSPSASIIKRFEVISTNLFKYESYWLNKIKKFQPAEIPFLLTTCPKIRNNTSFKLVQTVALVDSELARIHAISDNNNVKFIFLLTIWLIYLYRLGNKTNLGVVLNHPGLYQEHELTDFFSHAIPFSVNFHDQMNFEEAFNLVIKELEFVKNKKTYLIDIFSRYQSVANLNPFFPVTVVFEDIEPVDIKKFDTNVILKISALNNRIEWYLEQNSVEHTNNLQLFIENSSQHFYTLMTAIIENKNQAIKDLPLLSFNEKQILLKQWNNTKTTNPYEKNICTLLDKQFCKMPSNVALQYENESMTYQELKIKIDSLAYYFTNNLHINSGQSIIVHMPRSMEWIICVLAILKIGAIYIPVVENTPTVRFKKILADSNAHYILGSKLYLEAIKGSFGKKIQLLETDLILRTLSCEFHSMLTYDSSSNIVAYILYTSGTTGTPKGVVIKHDSLINLVFEQVRTLGINSDSKVLQFSSMGFDASIWEIFSTLIAGGTLCIPSDKQLLIGEGLAEAINLFKITLVTLPPSILQTIRPSGVRTLITLVTAGEPCSRELADLWVHDLCLINAYGPTESTVCATMCVLNNTTHITIGKPIANTQVYVLDEHLQPLPIGGIGELYLGGDGLAAGYLNQPELTSKYFLPNPFIKDAKTNIYKTGDLARWLPDGHLEYLGRIDNQIKIRGQRIELEAIEAQILHHGYITHCVISLKHNDNLGQFLVAYLVSKENIDLNTLREALKEHLPQYMIPNFFVMLDELPLTENGKIDRKSLPEPEITSSVDEHPVTEIEKKLIQIWTDLLDVKKIGVYDNFFNLGGNSLVLSQLILAIRDSLHFELHFLIFLKNPTIAFLAELISKKFHNVLDDNDNRRILKDIHLSDDIIPVHCEGDKKPTNSVLLTGATGFLGAHLLHRIHQNPKIKIFCLVRAPSSSTGIQVIKEALDRYGLNLSVDCRIVPVVGDLSKPNFSLNKDSYDLLAEEVDEIYHNGAFVNHLYNYEMLRATNVLGTIEILKLASQFKNKRIHYISTLSAMCNFTRKDGYVFEDFITPESEIPPSDGYSQTKWVSEKLLAEAAGRNFSINIYRPGWIFGNAVTGRFPVTGNHLLLLIKGCIQMKIAPDWNIKLNILPVDFVSGLIVDIAESNVFNNKVFNFSNRNQLFWIDIIHCLNDYGHQINLIPSLTWVDSLKKIGRDNAIFNLLPLYMNSGYGWEKSLNKISYSHDAHVQQAMDRFELSYPCIDSSLLFECFSFLKN